MPRIVTLLVGAGRDGDRPWLATLTFWAGIVASWTARLPPTGDHPLLLPEWLLLGHANTPTVTQLYGQIVDILRERSLSTVTLDDVYFGPGHNRHV